MFHLFFTTLGKKGFVGRNLESRFADIIVVIEDIHTFHLEAQMTKDNRIFLRVFEYGFYYAISTQSENDILEFPEPVIIYLDQQDGIPEESILHIAFGSQGFFDYRVKNYLYLSHDVTELNRKKMIVLIPFQVLRLRSLLKQKNYSEKSNRTNTADMEKIYRLQEEIKNNIIDSIKANLQFGNITPDDANQLMELTNQLYQHICADFELSGGQNSMKPLLPGALELPNDKYRYRIDELEKEITRYADEITRYADEITRYADENAQLKKRIEELESK